MYECAHNSIFVVITIYTIKNCIAKFCVFGRAIISFAFFYNISQKTQYFAMHFYTV